MNPKQDRQGARTTADLERKYDFGSKFFELNEILKKQNISIERQSDLLSEYIGTTDETLTDIKKDISALQQNMSSSDQNVSELSNELNILKNQLENAESEISLLKSYQEIISKRIKAGQPRNLLDNSYFANPVNQRGQTSYNMIQGTYCVDRWMPLNVSGVKNTAELTDNGIIFGNENNEQVYLTQRFVKGNFVETKTYTFVSCFADGTINFGGYLDFGNAEIDIVNLTFPANTKIKWVALYEGEYTAETLPEYQPKGYGVELYECRRYYREDEIAEVNHSGLSGMVMLNTPFYEPPMRVTPTYTIKNFAAGMGDLSEISAIANAWGGDNRRIKLNYTSRGVASQCVFTLVSNADL